MSSQTFEKRKPEEAIKRFHDSLNESDRLQAKRFSSLNKSRVDDFIDKSKIPSSTTKESVLDSIDGRKPNQERRLSTVSGVYQYSPDSRKVLSSRRKYNSPTLGSRTRFGDGDGSFWDTWLNSMGIEGDDGSYHPPSLPPKELFENGVESIPAFGFKRDRMKEIKEGTPYLKLPTYEERWREWKKIEEREIGGDGSKSSEGSIHESVSDEILKMRHELLTENESKTISSSSSSSNLLPPITKQNYFGEKARGEFFDSYKNVLQQSRYFVPPNAKKMLEEGKLPPELSIKYNIHCKSEESKEEKKREDGNDDEEEESEDEEERVFREQTEEIIEHFKTPSARTVYLLGCHKKSLLPIPSLILRREETDCLNLNHQGMGNTVAKIVSSSLESLPNLKKLYVADNRLTDEGVQSILQSVKKNQTITELDLSENKIDGDAADALAEYLASEDCMLTSLILKRADLDDEECGSFVESLETNQHLLSLNMSGNIVGIMEHINVLDPDFDTGGEVIAEFLRSDSCRLIDLDMSWNLIRLGSAVEIGRSLAVNQTLKSINLSYNAFGRDGGMAIGESLHWNNTLETLDISSNSIPESGALVMVHALRKNRTIKNIILDSNPLGKRGIRELISVPAEVGNRFNLSLNGCNEDMVDSTSWFDPEFPSGDYSLNLSYPYHRAIFLSLLKLVRKQEGVDFDTCSYHRDPPSEGDYGDPNLPEPIAGSTCYYDSVLDRTNSIISGNSGQQLQFEVKAHYRPPDGASDDLFREDIREFAEEAFYKFDEDGGGSIDTEELENCLNSLSFGHGTKPQARHILALYDSDGTGEIEKPEFVEFIVNLAEEARSMTMREKSVHIKGNGDEYISPDTGVIKAKVHHWRDQPDITDTLTSVEVQNLLALVRQMNNAAKIMEESLKEIKLRVDQAQAIFDDIKSEVVDKVELLAKLITRVPEPRHAHMLIELNLPRERDRLRLQSIMGNAYGAFMGCHVGHYKLRLNKFWDQTALIRLMEINSREIRQKSQYKKGLGDVSQTGNMSNFRNEHLNNNSIVLDQSFIDPMPKSGLLEFDYVSPIRPVNGAVTEMSNKRFAGLLAHIGLIKQADEDSVVEEVDAVDRHVDDDVPFIRSKKWSQRVSETLVFLYKDDPDGIEDLTGEKRKEMNSLLQTMSTPIFPPIGKKSDDEESKSILETQSMASLSLVSSLPSGNDGDDDSVSSLDAIKAWGKMPEMRATMLTAESKFETFSVDYREMLEEGGGIVDEANLKSLKTSDEAFLEAGGGENILEKMMKALIRSTCARYVSCAQIMVMMNRFKVGMNLWMPGLGTFRVEAIVAMFHRIIDFENFDKVRLFFNFIFDFNLNQVISILSPEEEGALIYRLGRLVLFDPMEPDGYSHLCMSRREDSCQNSGLLYFSWLTSFFEVLGLKIYCSKKFIRFT